MSWERPSDIDLVRDLLETADIDFEEFEDERSNSTYIETASGVYFTFNLDGYLTEVNNG